MYRDKKGQAAMEFLMTYGWAILAAIVVIGVLGTYFYFKGLSPSQATVQAPFYINAWSVTPTYVLLEIKNNGGEEYNITSVELTGCSAGGSETTEVNVSNGAMVPKNITCTSGSAGNTYKGDITITYKKRDSTIPLTSTGTIADSIS